MPVQNVPIAGRANALFERTLADSRTVVIPGQQPIAMATGPDPGGDAGGIVPGNGPCTCLIRRGPS